MTDQEKQWNEVDQYFIERLIPPDDALDAALKASEAAGLPSIHVSPAQGKLLHLLARFGQAKRILEIGTLGGYSAIWLGRALAGVAGASLVTLEFDPRYAEVAAGNLERAGLADIAELRIGPAIESLPKLEFGFDFTFIDADKPSTADYFHWAVKLTRPGGIIVVDNVVREGAVLDAISEDASVQGIQRFMEALAVDKRVDATAMQMVGTKGYDGFVVAIVKGS